MGAVADDREQDHEPDRARAEARRAEAEASLAELKLARLRGEGVVITMPLTSEEWGERAFQVRDPNGVIVQLVDWNAHTGE